jgi:hypothetical protein
MPRGIELVWWVAMLLAVIITVWSEQRHSADTMSIVAVVKEAIEEHPATLATILEALEVGSGGVRRDVLVAVDARRSESTEQLRARAVHRTARGPPQSAERRRARTTEP